MDTDRDVQRIAKQRVWSEAEGKRNGGGVAAEWRVARRYGIPVHRLYYRITTATDVPKEAASTTCGVTNRNRIRGGATQGERANDREALATKELFRRSSTRAGTVDVLTWGDLASLLKERRRVHQRDGARSQQTGHAPAVHRADGAAAGGPG